MWISLRQEIRIGAGVNHTPNAQITIAPFIHPWTASTYRLVPQQGTADKLDTVGDKIFTPVVYQNRGGTESLWADQTTMLNYRNGPKAITWYQFNVTGAPSLRRRFNDKNSPKATTGCFAACPASPWIKTEIPRLVILFPTHLCSRAFAMPGVFPPTR